MHYTDRQLAAAMASKELEARFQALRDSVGELDQKLQKVEASVRADLVVTQRTSLPLCLRAWTP